MAKLKTHQSIAKRFKVTKTGKVIKKLAGQDHFNARESGNVTRKKRRTSKADKTNTRNIKTFLPYA
jgi:large subunit ribosomal protein L35